MDTTDYIILYGSIAILVLLLLVGLGLLLKKNLKLYFLTTFSDRTRKASVLDVLEGDTILVGGISKTEEQSPESALTIRLIGVDTPENQASLYIDEAPFGREALEYVERKIPKGTQITLAFDKEEQDKFGKHLAYVYLSSGECLNRTIIQEGYGWIRKHAFEFELEKEFENLQEKAKDKQKGLWKIYLAKGILKEKYKLSQEYQDYKKRIEKNQ